MMESVNTWGVDEYGSAIVMLSVYLYYCVRFFRGIR
jgi:hypothetical protein